MHLHIKHPAIKLTLHTKEQLVIGQWQDVWHSTGRNTHALLYVKPCDSHMLLQLFKDYCSDLLKACKEILDDNLS